MPEILPIPKCGEHRQCLACAFPFWDKLTAEQQEAVDEFQNVMENPYPWEEVKD